MIEDEPAGPDRNVIEAELVNLVQDMGAGPDGNMSVPAGGAGRERDRGRASGLDGNKPAG